MTDNNKEVSPFCQNLLRIFYFAHLLLALAFSVYLLLKYNNIISPTITFAMIVIYGFMAVWVLLISFILIVMLVLSRLARGRRGQCASAAS